MAQFGEIKNDIIINVIESDDLEFVKSLPGEYVEISSDPKSEIRAGIGYNIDRNKNVFIPPPPYKDWVLNNENKWESPVEKPSDVKENEIDYLWDDKYSEWERVEITKDEKNEILLKRPNKKTEIKGLEDTDPIIKETI